MGTRPNAAMVCFRSKSYATQWKSVTLPTAGANSPPEEQFDNCKMRFPLLSFPCPTYIALKIALDFLLAPAFANASSMHL